MNTKRKAILDRIKSTEESIQKAMEYLQTGKHADWRGFRPLFHRKLKDGNVLAPHRDWVQNVFLPRLEREMKRAEENLERLEVNDGPRDERAPSSRHDE